MLALPRPSTVSLISIVRRQQMRPVLVNRVGLLRLALHEAAEPKIEMTALTLAPRLALEGVDEIGTGFGEGAYLRPLFK